jgi:hypothetical protein
MGADFEFRRDIEPTNGKQQVSIASFAGSAKDSEVE